jgi:CheY-like chemotaxis protein
VRRDGEIGGVPHPCDRVLVIEDDQDLLTAIGDFLTDAGIEPVLCRDGATALEYLRTGPPPDTILLDLTLQGVSSEEILSRLAGDERLRMIPVAGMSGYPLRRYAYLPSMDAFLEKPFDLEQLNQALSELCSDGAGVSGLSA